MNKVFQFLWFNFLKKLTPVIGSKNLCAKQKYRLLWQYRLSCLFPGKKTVIVGDSNAAVFDNYEVMKKFSRVVLSFGVGGTTANTWIDFFCYDKIGKKLYSGIKNKTVIWNIGGNYVLQNKMDDAQSGLELIQTMFPDSWSVNIPPIRTHFLDLLDNSISANRTKEQWDKDVKKVNAIIKKLWGVKCLDVYTFFFGYDKKYIFKDGIHYSKMVVDKFLYNIVRSI